MEQEYTYNCTFYPEVSNPYQIEFMTADKEMYLKVKQCIDMIISGDLDFENDISVEHGEG